MIETHTQHIHKTSFFRCLPSTLLITQVPNAFHTCISHDWYIFPSLCLPFFQEISLSFSSRTISAILIPFLTYFLSLHRSEWNSIHMGKVEYQSLASHSWLYDQFVCSTLYSGLSALVSCVHQTHCIFFFLPSVCMFDAQSKLWARVRETEQLTLEPQDVWRSIIGIDLTLDELPVTPEVREVKVCRSEQS